jgi:peptidoglycan/xylan/chitin deacetylase (PgdA/CDA1 family)
MKTIYTCFPGGRHKALSLSYDDGKDADRRLVETLNKAGMRGTFHINGGLLGGEGRVPASELASLYAGHEVSCHTLTHPTIQRCPREQVALQVLEDRRILEDIVGYPVRGLSYPNGSWDREIAAMLPGLGIEYARLVETTGEFRDIGRSPRVEDDLPPQAGPARQCAKIRRALQDPVPVLVLRLGALLRVRQ